MISKIIELQKQLDELCGPVELSSVLSVETHASCIRVFSNIHNGGSFSLKLEEAKQFRNYLNKLFEGE